MSKNMDEESSKGWGRICAGYLGWGGGSEEYVDLKARPYGEGPGRPCAITGGVRGAFEDAGESEANDIGGVAGEWTSLVREKRTCFPGINYELWMCASGIE